MREAARSSDEERDVPLFTSRGLTACVAACAITPLGLAQAPAEMWNFPIATTNDDRCADAVSDGFGGVFIAGWAGNSLFEPTSGGEDVVVARFNAAGTLTWGRQFGSSAHEETLALAADSGGRLFVAGRTTGAMAGANAGEADAFVVCLSTAGREIWTRQFGTTVWDEPWDVATDGAGGAFVAGQTEGSLAGANFGSWDMFIARYNDAGEQVWIQQLGTSGHDAAWCIAPDGAGGAYVGGHTAGSLGGPLVGSWDGIIARYTSWGEQLWIRQIGTTSIEHVIDIVSTGSTGFVIAGSSGGSLWAPAAGNMDAVVGRYTPDGQFVWGRQFGTAALDWAESIALDGVGGVFVSGSTYGSLAAPNAGYSDVFFTRFSIDGSQGWIGQFGHGNTDWSSGVAADGAGGLYLTGYWSKGPGTPTVGSYDSYVTRFGYPCKADCTGDGQLTVADFGCFQGRYVLSDPYADCNASGSLSIADFGCFQGQYVLGCP